MTHYLRSSVAFSWMALVVVLCIAALAVNGGFGILQRSALASGLLVLALLGSALFAVLLLRASSVQRWAFRSGVVSNEAARSLRFIAVFTGAFGIGILVDMLRFV